MIETAGIAPNRLKLELTESLMADRWRSRSRRWGCSNRCVTPALDADFGVGYSSLSMLADCR
jgi:EAL domain-containing protein (putative c-di-GMP-specific phosphodiesterase class I)